MDGCRMNDMHLSLNEQQPNSKEQKNDKRNEWTSKNNNSHQPGAGAAGVATKPI